jgi:hypothetical protein
MGLYMVLGFLFLFLVGREIAHGPGGGEPDQGGGRAGPGGGVDAAAGHTALAG